jgi:hypothetical protein
MAVEEATGSVAIEKSSAEADVADDMTRRERFERDGFLHIKGFASSEECPRLQKRMAELIDAWDPDATLAPVFTTDSSQQKNQGSSDYFLDSTDRIHFFLEKGAAREDGQGLNPSVPKSRALNKVGHGLHVVDETFGEYSHSRISWQNSAGLILSCLSPCISSSSRLLVVKLHLTRTHHFCTQLPGRLVSGSGWH